MIQGNWFRGNVKKQTHIKESNCKWRQNDFPTVGREVNGNYWVRQSLPIYQLPEIF